MRGTGIDRLDIEAADEPALWEDDLDPGRARRTAAVTQSEIVPTYQDGRAAVHQRALIADHRHEIAFAGKRSEEFQTLRGCVLPGAADRHARRKDRQDRLVRREWSAGKCD